MAERKPTATRRREIADAALAVIAERGLGGFTALAVARRVGVSDGALFRHFASKRAMVSAVVDRVEDVLFSGLPPAGDDPLARLGAFFLHRAAAFRDHPGVASLVHSDDLLRAASPADAARVQAFRRRSQALVRSCLAEAARQGALAEGLAPADAAALVFGALGVLARQGPGGGPGQASADGVWRALERTFRRGGLPGRRKIR